MPREKDDIACLAEEFAACRSILQAMGDETRQHILLEMMQMRQCGGVRVGAITQRTHLSRPAVSHHLRILKEAGVLKVRRKGTMNFYSFDKSAAAMRQLQQLSARAVALMAQLPEDEDDSDWKDE